MEQYKLVKDYPESPKLGTIVNDKRDRYYFYSEDGKYYLNISTLEKYFEYWEKMKEYKILSFKGSMGNYSRYLGNNQHIWDNDTQPRAIETDYLLNTGNHSIYSVKRLSDGEIFTIGDKVQHQDRLKNTKLEDIGYITKMELTSYGSILIHYGTRFNNSIGVLVKVPKEKLFTTEDGVDLYRMGYIVYPVDQFFNYISQYESCSLQYYLERIKDTPYHINNKVFSTKEKAEEYILLNKPCLSVNDVIKYCMDNFLSLSGNRLTLNYKHYNYLISLGKSKLKS